MSVEILCRCLVVLLRRFVCLLSSRAGNRLMYERLVPEAAACYQTALEIYFGRRAEQVQALNVDHVRDVEVVEPLCVHCFCSLAKP